MTKLIMTTALGGAILLLTACGGDADTTADDSALDTAATPTSAPASATVAAADWPKGTRIVQEGDVAYRVDPAGARVRIEDGSNRVVVENGVRYRVDRSGTRHKIDDDGIDIDLPAVEGVDIDLGTNKKGNLDLDVSTDGSDASTDRGGDR